MRRIVIAATLALGFLSAPQVSGQDPYRTHLQNMYEGADMKYAFDRQKPARLQKWQKQ